MKRYGLPITKAAYLLVMYHLDAPSFPLDAEIAASIPEELDGPMPTHPADLVFPLTPDEEREFPTD